GQTIESVNCRPAIDFAPRTNAIQCDPFHRAGPSIALPWIGRKLMPTALLTGFPGFLASAFLPNFLARTDRQIKVACLVQSHFRAMAEERGKKIVASNPDCNGRLQIVEGDITQPGMELKDAGKALRADMREVYHFAAIYDLAVPRPLGMRINV